jgi:hypothetical protein
LSDIDYQVISVLIVITSTFYEFAVNIMNST